MNTELLGKVWDSLGDRQVEMVTTFYTRFFDRFPDYRGLFPDTLDRQMKKMLETVAMIARTSDETEVMHPHMAKVGSKHVAYQLTEQDLINFRDVFIEVLSEFADQEQWSDTCQNTWHQVFEEHVIPHMMKGMQGQA